MLAIRSHVTNITTSCLQSLTGLPKIEQLQKQLLPLLHKNQAFFNSYSSLTFTSSAQIQSATHDGG